MMIEFLARLSCDDSISRILSENTFRFDERQTLKHVKTGFWLFWAQTNSISESTTTTEKPTEKPTDKPTQAPTEKPTEAPTKAPTQAPTEKPTEAPTKAPTEAPTEKPTEAPTKAPTEAPTEKPTEAPTKAPTEAPTEAPTGKPDPEPTEPATTPSVPTTTIVIDIRFPCKVPFSDDLLDENSDAYSAVVESFKFITDVFEAIANALGIEVEFKFKFSPPGGNRRRRAAATWVFFLFLGFLNVYLMSILISKISQSLKGFNFWL